MERTEQGGWFKYEGNPVMGNADMGTCFDIQVNRRPGGGYRMNFSWRPKRAIAMADSADGIHWSEPEIILEPNPASGWEDVVNRSCIVKRNGLFHLWYTGQIMHKCSHIGHAVSKDGRHFERTQEAPVLSPELDWEKDSVMNPFVLLDETRGCFRMWYAGGEQYEPNALGYAESQDGICWTKYPQNPVLTHGTDFYDQNRVGGCEVIPLPDGTFALFYIGYEDIDTARICCAYSKDGITGWRRSTANPLLSPDAGKWDGDACYKPSLQYDEENDRWLLWYNGRLVHSEYIGLAIHPGKNLMEKL